MDPLESKHFRFVLAFLRDSPIDTVTLCTLATLFRLQVRIAKIRVELFVNLDEKLIE